MAGTAKAVPEGYHTLTPHLTVRDAARAIEFYQKAFGATVLGISHGPGGKIMHAALKMGDSIFMLNDEFPGWGTLSPLATGGSGVAIHVYLENVDAAWERAVSAGATVKMPLMDAFWGDRYGQVKDPFGHTWSLATHIQNLSADEIRKGQDAAMGKMPQTA